jgi:L-alanine-DL-glutamate epimerase-like enolase superfamily enzyme
MPATITRIAIYKMNVMLKEPFKIALSTTTCAENVLVRIETSDGLYGFGEGSPLASINGETQATAFEAAKFLAPLLIGRNPTDIEGCMREMDTALPRNGVAKSAFDLALYDLLGKRAGLPLYALLGGSNRRIQTDLTISITPPEEIGAKALAIRNRDFRCIKLKLGTNHHDDVARVRAVREAVGNDVSLRVDANQGWNPTVAIAVLREIEQYGIEYCEQPVPAWNYDALKRVRDASPIPIVADEACFDHRDAWRLASMGAADMFNIKLCKASGIHNALKINAIAEAAGMKCMVGCMFETRIGISASAHLAAARPNIAYADLDAILLHAEDPVMEGVRYEGDEVVLPDAPGIGADVDPAYLAGLESVTV